ncbi:lipid-binding SYLF domain-containing protein [Pelagibius litoralis]|uniref:Lipid-binding SYLF domain-containing protein n=1 Tax=Pelagibius litoralis TaxID=374515 RepID=A0A967EY72_9PROT|nr:lipid-binding SYLF domain-containing protein [Pelagibius litoralis]NIA69608.1 lipid-binding SYLF domain-containing protein [Pelagibius litoralis]
MMRLPFPAMFTVLMAAMIVLAFQGAPARAEKAATIEQHSREALALLLQQSEAAKRLADDASGILVFPKIVKGGLIVGGQYGEGALFKSDDVAGYYSTASASFGLQAGLQTFGYAIFFLNDDGLKFLDNSDGWEIGTAPNVVLVDKGAGASLTTTSGRGNIYVFFFDQKGLMAGVTVEGTKITTINPE